MPCFEAWHHLPDHTCSLPTCCDAKMKQNGAGFRVWVFLSSFRFITFSEGYVPAGTGATTTRSPHTTEDSATIEGASRTSRDTAPSSVMEKAQSSTAGDLHLGSPCQHQPPMTFQGGTDVVVKDLL